MQIRDTEQDYSWVSIILHWVAAVLVITMFVLGERIGFQPTRALERTATNLHISVGVLAWVFLAAFLVWRLAQRSPKDPEQHWSLKLLATIVHWGLLLVIVIQIITGPLMIWALGAPLNPFGWFQIPSPLTRNHDLREFLAAIHGTTANVFIGLITLRVLGAFKHLLIDHDRVFQRIFWPQRQH